MPRIMQWSKIKRRAESLFAASGKGRVELRTTNYRHASDWEGRGWITLDGTEIASFCTFKYWIARGEASESIQEALGREGERAVMDRAQAQAVENLHQAGVLSQDSFELAIQEYTSLTIDDALASPHLIHRALAVLDRRMGKRRLTTTRLQPDEHPLVRRLFQFRCAAERFRDFAVS